MRPQPHHLNGQPPVHSSQTGATTPAPAPVSASQKAQLTQIEKAYAGGVITRDQYEAQKKKILTPK